MSDIEVIRVNIAGEWTAIEFSQFLGDMQFLADVARFSDVGIAAPGAAPGVHSILWGRKFYYPTGGPSTLEELNDEEILIRSRLTAGIREHNGVDVSYGFDVQRIEFGSPGFVDLAGLGKVAEQVRIFMTDIIDRYFKPADQREIDRQKILRRKIENAERLAKLADKMNLDPESKKAIIAETLGVSRFMEGRVLAGQLVSIETPATASGKSLRGPTAS